jgi:glutamate-1-semialdehyde 2,1-aminomutase
VGGEPFFTAAAEGPYLVSEEGRRYIDYVMGYGPLILGHAHPAVVAAITEQAQRGVHYGTPTRLEVEMAEFLTGAVTGLEVVRMVNSGTEATMAALRVARAVTGRQRIVKFAGSYHGHFDGLLVKAGSGAATLGVPDSAGVLEAVARMTVTVPYNDLEALRAVFQQYGPEIAAVIAEPIAGNMGTVVPDPNFLPTIRQLTRESGALWISDEVMTGFRVGFGTVAQQQGLQPDLVTMAKVIGGGLPVGAYGGSRAVMAWVAPSGPVYQAGTFSGNPVALAAGLAQLNEVSRPGFYVQLAEKTRHLATELAARARRHHIPASFHCAGGMFTLFFCDKPPQNFDQVAQSDRERYRRYFHGMLERGIFMPPSPFESVFVSQSHGEREIEATLTAADDVFSAL